MTEIKKIYNSSKGLKYVKQPLPETKQKRDRHKKRKVTAQSENTFSSRILRNIGSVADAQEFLSWIKKKQ